MFVVRDIVNSFFKEEFEVCFSACETSSTILNLKYWGISGNSIIVFNRQ